jgi:norsolorinic acid ketoreductase
LSAYLARPNHVVVAGLRDPLGASSKELESLPHGPGSELILVAIDSSSQTDAKSAVEQMVSKHGIKKLDMVTANAGISKYFGKATLTPAEEMLDHFTVNTIAPLLLFQACAPLLQAASAPKFVVVSSGAGSLSNVVNLPVENTAYGASKAAVNFVTRRIHYENPHLTAFVLNPGWLQTDVSTAIYSFRSSPDN